MWICPSCEEEITRLRFEVPTTSYDRGDAYLRKANLVEGQHRKEIVDDYNTDDSGDNEWDGDISYFCPHCDDQVNLFELIWRDPEPVKETKKKEEPKKPEEPEETLHKIIKPEIELGGEKMWRENQANFLIICKKCKHTFPTDPNARDSELYECPKCGTMMTKDEFWKLFNEGKFQNKKRIIKLKEFKITSCQMTKLKKKAPKQAIF